MSTQDQQQQQAAALEAAGIPYSLNSCGFVFHSPENAERANHIFVAVQNGRIIDGLPLYTFTTAIEPRTGIHLTITCGRCGFTAANQPLAGWDAPVWWSRLEGRCSGVTMPWPFNGEMRLCPDCTKSFMGWQRPPAESIKAQQHQFNMPH